MKNKVIFSDELIETMQNAIEIAEFNGIERSTPIIIFKGLLDLESSSIYDYLMDNTCYDSNDIEMAFQDVLYSLELVKTEEVKQSEKEEVENLDGEKIEDDTYSFKIDKTQESIIFDKETAKLITRAVEIATEEKSAFVKVEYLCNAIAENIPKDILMFLRNLGVNIKDFKKTFSNKKDFIPVELQSFMKILNSNYQKDTKCSILGRDKECEVVWKTLQKKTKRNVILVGDPGVGKSSIVKKMTHDIVSSNCPEAFEDFFIISVDVNSAIAGTKYRGQAEERFKAMIDFLEKTEKVIVFIDEVHTILGAGATKEGEMDLANALKPILAEDKVRVIGATTKEEYDRYFSKDGALKRRFRPVKIKEPTSKEVYPMLKNAISELSKYHGVKISKDLVEYIILISACFNYETKNPDRTIDLVDLSMVTAKTDGKKYVDKESVLKNFNINFKKFEKMDYGVKKSTAYHEAGHYLVWRFAKSISDLEGIAVSIMPAENYLGVTVFDELDDEVTVTGDMEYFIDDIAMDLAGRVAEKMYTKTISSGASADLENATKRAYSIVARYGMADNFGKNRIYFDSEDYSMCSEKTKDAVNEEIDKIIEKAYQRAEAILLENEVYLKKLVNQLMRKGIVSKKDLDRIFEEETSKKQN